MHAVGPGLSVQAPFELAPDVPAAPLPIPVNGREMATGGGVENENRSLEPTNTVNPPVSYRDIAQTQVNKGGFAPVMDAPMTVHVVHIRRGEITLRQAEQGV